jgi:hypothetical protein
LTSFLAEPAAYRHLSHLHREGDDASAKVGHGDGDGDGERTAR